MTDAMDIVVMAARLVQFASAMFLLGAPAFVLATMLCCGGAQDLSAELARWLRRSALVAVAATILSSLAWLDIEAAIMGSGWENTVDPDTLSAVLFETVFGRVWQWHLGFELALVVLLLVPARGSGWMALVTLVGALHLGSLAWIGHAMMDMGMGEGVRPIVVQTVHILAGGLWLGSLPALFHLARSARGMPAAEAAVRTMLPHYSRAGYVAVAAILLSGIGNSLFLVESIQALFATPFGRVLLLKLVLVAAMMGMALGNRMMLSPAIAAGASAGPIARLARSVVAEQGLAILILAAVSVLGVLPPAMHMNMG
jgi:copper resistance protein D